MTLAKKILPLIVLIALGMAYFVYRGFGMDRETLAASGVLEARNINVGSKVGGRVSDVLVREGDAVNAEQVLLTFEPFELSAELEQARGRLAQVEAVLAKMQNGSRPEDIAESTAAADARTNSPGFRREEVEAAKADLARTEADLANAERDLKRMDGLMLNDATSRQAQDAALTRRDMARAQVRSARHTLDAAQGRLRAAEAVMQRTQNGFRDEDVAAARADVLAAQGVLHAAEARWREREVRAPADAVVEVMDLRPGHLMPPNAIVAKLLEVDQLFVIVYVPETRIGHVRLGQSAEVRVDSFPDRVFHAKVEQIRQQAEFLPRNVQTLEERVHQVIGVKLRVENAERLLRAGIHAEVRFDTPTE